MVNGIYASDALGKAGVRFLHTWTIHACERVQRIGIAVKSADGAFFCGFAVRIRWPGSMNIES